MSVSVSRPSSAASVAAFAEGVSIQRAACSWRSVRMGAGLEDDALDAEAQVGTLQMGQKQGVPVFGVSRGMAGACDELDGRHVRTHEREQQFPAARLATFQPVAKGLEQLLHAQGDGFGAIGRPCEHAADGQRRTGADGRDGFTVPPESVVKPAGHIGAVAPGELGAGHQHQLADGVDADRVEAELLVGREPEGRHRERGEGRRDCRELHGVYVGMAEMGKSPRRTEYRRGGAPGFEAHPPEAPHHFPGHSERPAEEVRAAGGVEEKPIRRGDGNLRGKPQGTHGEPAQGLTDERRIQRLVMRGRLGGTQQGLSLADGHLRAHARAPRPLTARRDELALMILAAEEDRDGWINPRSSPGEIGRQAREIQGQGDHRIPFAA